MSIISKIKLRRVNKDSASKAEYLRSRGMVIGKNNRILCNVVSFGTEPFLIKMGDNCCISADCSFITHDGGVGVLNALVNTDEALTSEKLVKMSPIIMGNNVYIGARTIVLPGVRIGSNVVIGAGSVVTKNIPDNTVWAGNPAKFICDLQTYADKALNNGKVWKGLDGTSLEYKRKYFESINILEV